MKDAKKHWKAAKEYGIFPMPTPEEVARDIDVVLKNLYESGLSGYCAVISESIKAARQEGFNEGVEASAEKALNSPCPYSYPDVPRMDRIANAIRKLKKEG